MTIDQWQRAFVLHRREYSENSLLVEFLPNITGGLLYLLKVQGGLARR
ncbi:recombination protein O N-terminal domain-containing protein [Mannheimia haemolytica]|nr:recombination protein O N-terminal domain-containing protein [Mannheimia haemolytica]